MKRMCWMCLTALAACAGPAPPEPQPSVEVETAVAQRGPIRETLSVYGTTEFDPAATRVIPIEFEARIVSLSVSLGQSVAEGAALMTLQPSASTRLELGRLEREARMSAAELARLQRLRADDLATNADVETARVAAENAAQALASLSERAAGERLTIRAPRAGVVDALPFAPGDLAAAGSIIARIGVPRRLQVRLGLEAEDVARTEVGQEVTLVTLRPQPITLRARIAATDRRLDSQTRLASAIAELPEGADVLAGEPVRATLVVDTRNAALTVPRSAVLYERDRPYLFTISAGKAVRREVALGIEDRSSVEVIRGLEVGATVVTRGNYELTDGMAVRTAQAQSSGTP